MARTGRPRNRVPTVPWRVYIPADLAAKVELLINDPLRDKAKYGERGQLIEGLLREWLEKQQKQEVQAELPPP